MSKYDVIAKILQERIRAGKYKPGELLPSLAELGREFKVSSSTVTRAMRLLKLNSLVTYTPADYGNRVRITPIEAVFVGAPDGIDPFRYLFWLETPGYYATAAEDTVWLWAKKSDRLVREQKSASLMSLDQFKATIEAWGHEIERVWWSRK